MGSKTFKTFKTFKTWFSPIIEVVFLSHKEGGGVSIRVKIIHVQVQFSMFHWAKKEKNEMQAEERNILEAYELQIVKIIF